MNFFLVCFTESAPLTRYGLQTEEIQESGQAPYRALMCRSVTGTPLGLVRLEPREQKPEQEIAFHVPLDWIAAIAEGSKETRFGFRAARG